MDSETRLREARAIVEQLRSLPRQNRERYISRLVENALASHNTRRILLSLRGGTAAQIMQGMLQVLEGGSLALMSERFLLRRLLLNLSRLSGTLPPSLFINDVHCPDIHATTGGGFADIFRATYRNAPVAMKRIRVFRNDEDYERKYTGLCREALVWQIMKHRHILPFLGVDRNTFRPHYCLVSPWAELGNINECMKWLIKQGKNIPAKRWLHEIALGLQYLHEEKIIHGDLRGANILIHDPDDLEVQLADFGLVQFADPKSESTTQAMSGGTVRWMAPEILDGSKPTFAGDIYAFGCVWLELSTRQPPFAHLLIASQVIMQVAKGTLPPWPTKGIVTSELRGEEWNFIQDCWHGDPLKRPNADYLVNTILDLVLFPRPPVDVEQEYIEPEKQVEDEHYPLAMIDRSVDLLYCLGDASSSSEPSEASHSEDSTRRTPSRTPQEKDSHCNECAEPSELASSN